MKRKINVSEAIVRYRDFAAIPVGSYFKMVGLPYKKLTSTRAILLYKWNYLDKWGQSTIRIVDIDRPQPVLKITKEEAFAQPEDEYPATDYKDFLKIKKGII